jgi:hypothetical protein
MLPPTAGMLRILASYAKRRRVCCSRGARAESARIAACGSRATAARGACCCPTTRERGAVGLADRRRSTPWVRLCPRAEE